MIKTRILQSRYAYRFAESLVPIMVWLVITMPIWLSLFHPAIASYLILAFFLYFLYKTIKTVYFAGISYTLIQRAERINWFGKLKKRKNYPEIYHFFIIANYKESASKLKKTLDRLRDQNYPKEKISIVLAMEEREGEAARTRGAELTKEYQDTFAGFYTAYHPLLEGEVVGKASNGTYAAKYISKLAREKNLSPENIIVTVCDADSLMPKNYLPYVTYKFIMDKDRLYRFFWAPVLLYSNFWKLPLPVRVQSILSSVARFAYLSQKDDLIQISTYSTNLWLLEKVGYWDTDIIPEDWHIYLQAFFKFGEKVKTIPIYLPISRDGVLSTGLLNTFRSRYSQERRWAWGASDIPYAILRFFNTPHIKPLAKLKKILFITEVHFLWPTSFFILTLSASIPPLVNPEFERTVMGFLLPKLSSVILTLTSMLLVVMLYFDHKLREKVDAKTRIRNLPMLFIQWYFLPIISFFFSSLPALESHTRMLLGKKLEYKVTEKV